MNFKPKYNLFKNTKYAIDGLFCAIKNETSFKIELIVGAFFILLLFIINLDSYMKLILVITYFLILIVELINSAIENSIDLITKEINPLAKNAKDIAATAVMFAIILHIICWGFAIFGGLN